MKKTVIIAMLLTASTIAVRAQTTYYWGPSAGNIRSSANWSASSNGPFNITLPGGGPVMAFATNTGSAITGSNVTVSGITVTANVTNWIGNSGANGRINTFSNNTLPANVAQILTINVASGVLADFGTQEFSRTATAGFIKNGDGVLAFQGGNHGLGSTLNAGTLVLGASNNVLGSGANNFLVLNGGILTARTNFLDLSGKFAAGITIGGNIQFGVDPSVLSISTNRSDLDFNNAVSLGNATRTLTIGSSARTTFNGAISSSGGAGLIITNLSGALGRFTLGGANTYAGGTTVNGGLLVIATNSTVSGGVITSGPVGTGTLVLGNGASLWSDSTNQRTLQNNLSLSGLVTMDSQAITNVNFLRFNSTGLTTAATIALTGDTTINTGNTNATSSPRIFFDNTITGAFNLTKTNLGSLYLGASNSFSGVTRVEGGTLQSTRSVALTNSASVVVTNAGSTLAVNYGGGSDYTVAEVGTLLGKTTFASTATALGFDTVNGNGTYAANLTIAAGLTKLGANTLTLTGTNTYTGATTVSTGTLNLNTTTGSAAGSTTSVSVTNSAILLISQSEQVSDTATVSLSGGTIQLGGAVSETFGALSVTSASFLDFNNAEGANMSFDTYTPTQSITVNNFIGYSTLTFKSDMTDFINDPALFSFTNGFSSAAWDNTTSTFTITAIPEPGTILAAVGLAGLFAWPMWRHLLARRRSDEQA
jgi:autotransporter-associated beta strand protein